MINPIFYTEFESREWFKLRKFCMRDCVCRACQVSSAHWDEWKHPCNTYFAERMAPGLQRTKSEAEFRARLRELVTQP